MQDHRSERVRKVIIPREVLFFKAERIWGDYLNGFEPTCCTCSAVRVSLKNFQFGLASRSGAAQSPTEIELLHRRCSVTDP